MKRGRGRPRAYPWMDKLMADCPVGNTIMHPLPHMGADTPALRVAVPRYAYTHGVEAGFVRDGNGHPWLAICRGTLSKDVAEFLLGSVAGGASKPYRLVTAEVSAPLTDLARDLAPTGEETEPEIAEAKETVAIERMPPKRKDNGGGVKLRPVATRKITR